MSSVRVRSRWRLVVCVLAGCLVVGLTHLGADAQSPRRDPEQRLLGSLARVPQPAVNPIQLTGERAQAFVEARIRGLDYLPGEVLVKFRDGTTVGQAQRALMAVRSRPSVGDLQWIGDVALLRDRSQPNPHILAEQLASQPEVEYAEPNYLAYTSPQEGAWTSALRTGSVGTRLGQPNDPSYAGKQWNFAALDMPRAWDINPGADPSIIVAVVDTGITVVNQTYAFTVWTGSGFESVTMPFATSPDLESSRLVSPVDFIFSAPGGVVLDMDGHGTHVASTVAESTNNQLSLAGMAYRARIMPVKVCTDYWEVMIARAASGITGFAPSDSGGCPFSSIASGVRYAADNGARVINISLGSSSPSTTLRDALVYAVGRGAFISVSMGNEFEDGNPTRYPAFYARDIAGMMSVASTGRSLTRAYYSSTGAHTEIAAPGGSSRDGSSGSGLIHQVTLRRADFSTSVTHPRFDRYEEAGFQGTSMAAPHVAGTAALLFSQGVRTPAQVESLIKSTARDLGASGRDDEFGHGLIQPRTALFGRGIAK